MMLISTETPYCQHLCWRTGHSKSVAKLSLWQDWIQPDLHSIVAELQVPSQWRWNIIIGNVWYV